MKIGVTGQNGFIGWHLSQTLKYIFPLEFKLIPFERNFFYHEDLLDKFTSDCNCIIHLAGVNRDSDESNIKKVNIELSKKLIESFDRIKFKGKLIFSSSYKEDTKTLYGISKKEARENFILASKRIGFMFTGLIIPNVYGPFCKPNYNSFIATFCYQISRDINPKIIHDNEVELIYVDNLVKQIINCIKSEPIIDYKVSNYKRIRVSLVLDLIRSFHNEYAKQNKIPKLDNTFKLELFNTYRSYLKINRYPIKHKNNIDQRGNFVETIKTLSGGQFSFSTTEPGIERGNHFHTRKIERFSVIKGNAEIKLRKIGTKTTDSFKLSGDSPSFIDMPLWYTHNLKNIGKDKLITLFWINELYDKKDPDTYLEIV